MVSREQGNKRLNLLRKGMNDMTYKSHYALNDQVRFILESTSWLGMIVGVKFKNNCTQYDLMFATSEDNTIIRDVDSKFIFPVEKDIGLQHKSCSECIHGHGNKYCSHLEIVRSPQTPCYAFQLKEL